MFLVPETGSLMVILICCLMAHLAYACSSGKNIKELGNCVIS